MPRRPRQTNASRPGTASPSPASPTSASTPPTTDGSPQSTSQAATVDPPEDLDLPASELADGVSTSVSAATPLRELLDAALHPKAGNPAKASSSHDSDSPDDGSPDDEVPRNRRERRSKTPRGSNQPDRSYPSQTSLGHNGFARNPRRSPTRRQG